MPNIINENRKISEYNQHISQIQCNTCERLYIYIYIHTHIPIIEYVERERERKNMYIHRVRDREREDEQRYGKNICKIQIRFLT